MKTLFLPSFHAIQMDKKENDRKEEKKYKNGTLVGLLIVIRATAPFMQCLLIAAHCCLYFLLQPPLFF